jgi:pimeloyl-ACP methyl ester carboxylesterase
MKKLLLHSVVSGEGDIIVFLHGYLSSSHYFSRMQKQLSTTHKVISLDLLGFGKSPKPRTEHTYTSQVALIHTTLENLGIDRSFTLIGHSMGALIAARYAITHSKDVSSLQLFNPPIYKNPEQALQTLTDTGPHYRAMITSPFRPLFWLALQLKPHIKSIKRPPINYADTIRMSAHAREGMMHNVIADPALFSDLQKITQRTLLIVGKYDRSIYQDNLERSILPENITLKIIETGHHPIVKNAIEAEALIRGHIPRPQI